VLVLSFWKRKTKGQNWSFKEKLSFLFKSYLNKFSPSKQVCRFKILFVINICYICRSYFKTINQNYRFYSKTIVSFQNDHFPFLKTIIQKMTGLFFLLTNYHNLVSSLSKPIVFKNVKTIVSFSDFFHFNVNKTKQTFFNEVQTAYPYVVSEV